MTRRQEKVASLIMRELSDILNRKVSDPRVRGVHFVSVDVSPDFHLARVTFSTLESDRDPELVQKGLDSAKPFLRRELKKVLQLRIVPELAFSFDPSIRHGDQILNLLKKLQD
ncbi:MAG: ribosome-binding factor [Clostridiales bacterium]|jgi:ribosome-binding factor A|nr:ribosome-binding factor [Clostridiales bacterium]MDN5281685.1 ribosome-binding factor [Candidatus Ozemobacter sp.]